MLMDSCEIPRLFQILCSEKHVRDFVMLCSWKFVKYSSFFFSSFYFVNLAPFKRRGLKITFITVRKFECRKTLEQPHCLETKGVMLYGHLSSAQKSHSLNWSPFLNNDIRHIFIHIFKPVLLTFSKIRLLKHVTFGRHSICDL